MFDASDHHYKECEFVPLFANKNSPSPNPWYRRYNLLGAALYYTRVDHELKACKDLRLVLEESQQWWKRQSPSEPENS